MAKETKTKSDLISEIEVLETLLQQCRDELDDYTGQISKLEREVESLRKQDTAYATALRDIRGLIHAELVNYMNGEVVDDSNSAIRFLRHLSQIAYVHRTEF